MKLINTSAELKKQLNRLIKKYPMVAIATAWASADTVVFRTLIEHRKNIVQAVIGTHFYQTHPDVLDEFVGSSKVKFILQPQGVFHPKVYLFWSPQHWEVVIGSPNLTAGALTRNSELSVLITSEDGTPELKQVIGDVIKSYWDGAETVTKSDAENYRNMWKLKARDLKKIEDVFGGKAASKPAIQSKIMPMNWPSYLAEVKKDKTHGFNERLAMLKVVGEQFDQYDHFNDMPLDVRKGVAGLPNKTIKDWAWFGSMKGAMTFGGLINKGHEAFSLALDEIPAEGEVRKEHYDAYVKLYLTAYPGKWDGLATASRLLAMKRPDTFLCVDAENKRKLAEDLGIVASGLDYERYWDEVVLRLKESPWWQSPEPTNATEKAVWRARAAMLDAIFYEVK